MPRPKKKVAVKFEFKGFINLEFNDAEKVEISDWIKSFKPALGDTIVCIIEAEYKLGITYDDYHEVNHISATCKRKTSKYYGYVFVLKHVDVERGLAIMRYVYDLLLATDLFEVEEKGKGADW